MASLRKELIDNSKNTAKTAATGGQGEEVVNTAAEGERARGGRSKKDTATSSTNPEQPFSPSERASASMRHFLQIEGLTNITIRDNDEPKHLILTASNPNLGLLVPHHGYNTQHDDSRVYDIGESGSDEDDDGDNDDDDYGDIVKLHGGRRYGGRLPRAALDIPDRGARNSTSFGHWIDFNLTRNTVSALELPNRNKPPKHSEVVLLFPFQKKASRDCSLVKQSKYWCSGWHADLFYSVRGTLNLALTKEE
eukprot:jgi/Bigna1/71503/fgenesh1_pg.16_\